MILRFLLLVLVFQFNPSLFGYDNGLRVYFLQKLTNGTPGQTVVLQVLLNNQSHHSLILIDNLDLPPGWKALPVYQLYGHLSPNQSYTQTIVLQIPDDELDGDYRVRYTTWARNNINIQESDDTIVIVRTPAPEVCTEEVFFEIEDEELPLDNQPQPLFSVVCGKKMETSPGKILYISTCLHNETDLELCRTIQLQCPDGWQSIPSESIEAIAEPEATCVKIFAIKIPEGLFAGDYPLTFSLEGESEKHTVIVSVLPEVLFSAYFEGLQNCYPLGEPIELKLLCKNESNVSIRLNIKAKGDPLCQMIHTEEPFEIPPQETYEVILFVKPKFDTSLAKQFVLVEINNADTGERFYQNSLCLLMSQSGSNDEDLYNRIPCYARAIALGDNGDHVLAAEFAGGGLIDPERNRYLDFFFRIPTDSRNVIYSIDQRMYVGVWEDDWSVDLGDTVYVLSPLTQRSNYGRGGGFDISPYPWFYGAHYTQNTFNNDYNPKQSCAYVGYSPSNWADCELNYMHQDLQEYPTTNIVTISSDMQFPGNAITELELGKNFVSNKVKGDRAAFRFATRGRSENDCWYDIEKVYAGSAFYGYYQHLDLFATTVDFPLGNTTRGNLSYSRLKQNFDIPCSFTNNCLFDFDEDDGYPLKPRQRQFSGKVIYSFENGLSVSPNCLWLRAKDVGVGSEYNFNQQWAGVTCSLAKREFVFVTNCSFGRQKNYLTGHTTSFLQQYYLYLGKDFSEDIQGTLFYEGGNTNYYDAGPWRTSFGGSIRYRYGRGSFMELYLQRVNNTPDRFQLSQVTYNLNHNFKNLHSLQASVQYFHYKTHYRNDFLFMVSYTIPFTTAVGRRKDIGSLDGYVFDTYTNRPISNATVNCNGLRTVTSEEGRFAFRSLPTGEHLVKTEILPSNLICQNVGSDKVNVLGGKNNLVNIPVSGTCLIEGEILRYSFEDSLESLAAQFEGKSKPKLVEQGGARGIRVFISRDNGKEVYTALTDGRGRFCFPKLRPGNWEVWASTTFLPDLHYLEPEKQIVALEPGEKERLTFKIIPQAQQIQQLE